MTRILDGSMALCVIIQSTCSQLRLATISAGAQ
jgi:hypothetical protein